MTVVYFVRHAEPNVENHDDFSRELTEKGKEDSKLVTDFLADKKIEIVLSSPYCRSVETVRDFFERFGLNCQMDVDFREREIGTWVEDFGAYSKKQWEDFSYCLPSGESLRDVQERNIRALRKALNKYVGKNIVIGSHGTALSTVLRFFIPAYGYSDFQRIRSLMPWVVRFDFSGEECEEIEEYNLFDETRHLLFQKLKKEDNK